MQINFALFPFFYKPKTNCYFTGFLDAALKMLLHTTLLRQITFCNFMPCPFTGPKMIWAGPNLLCHTKNLFT